MSGELSADDLDSSEPDMSAIQSTLTPDTCTDKFESFERINSIRVTNINFDPCNSCKRWFPAVYMSCMSQNFRLLQVSNLSVLNFRIFLHMYPGSLSPKSSKLARVKKLATAQSPASVTAGRRSQAAAGGGCPLKTAPATSTGPTSQINRGPSGHRVSLSAPRGVRAVRMHGSGSPGGWGSSVTAWYGFRAVSLN